MSGPPGKPPRLAPVLASAAATGNAPVAAAPLAARPRPLTQMPILDLDGVLTDIDDTLTTEGKLKASAYSALERLRAAGLKVVPVTGRSAGWAHMILKTWPVDAVVAESGGLYLARDPRSARLREVLHAPAEQVADERAGVLALARRIMAELPGLAPASDNPYRRVDVAIDWCEEVDPVPAEHVTQAIARFHAAGYAARASSVHINAWAGRFDKAPMALRCLHEIWGIDTATARRRWLFVGDAPNDASMFEAFPHSVGVANIVPVLDRLPAAPAWVTQASHGGGFEELARRLLADRHQPEGD